MKFAEPLWLLAGLAACIFLAWRFRQFNRQQRAALASFVSERLRGKLTASFSATRRWAKQALFIAGVGCLFVALARPQAGFRWEETHRKGLELLFAVDTSKSMLAEDVKPNRLTRAKFAVNDLVNKLNGDGVGLVAFAGNAFLQCPITLDYDAFRESLDALDTSVIPRGGTDIASAIREAQATFKTRTEKEHILVLLTDGEDLGGEAVTAAQAAASDGLKIFTVGVGSASGELVPVPNENGHTEFAKDASGQFVKSKLDEATLQKIAEATGGMYRPLGQQGQGLTAIYEQGLAAFTRHDLASRQTKVYLEQFHWALLAALACFIGEMLLGTRRRTKKVAASQPAAVAPKFVLNPRPAVAMLGLALFGWPFASHASPGSAEKAYQQGKFAEAAREYAATATKQPNKAELQFNLGSAAYKSGDYAQAAAAFQHTLKTGAVPVQQSAYYNLGNTQYRLGQKTEQTAPQKTIKAWEQAVQTYEAALQINPDDADAKFNRDLVKRKLEQLKQQQQQQKEQEKKDQKDQQQQPKSGEGQPHQPQEKNEQSKPDKNGQSQQDKKTQAENKPDEKRSDGQPEPKDQNSQNKPEQNTQGQSGEKDLAKNQPQINGSERPNSPKPDNQKPEPPKTGEAKPAHGDEPTDKETQASEGERREPGQMTKEEAKQLLNSLKGEERKLAPVPHSRRASQPRDEQTLKDW